MRGDLEKEVIAMNVVQDRDCEEFYYRAEVGKISILKFYLL